jgi:hypothetical protein
MGMKEFENHTEPGKLVMSLESSLFEAIDDNDQKRVLEITDRIIKAACENNMLIEWVENIFESKQIELGDHMKQWMTLRFEYWAEMVD